MAYDPDTYERLILKQLEEQTTAEEAHALAAWLNASPDHQRQYDQLKNVWELTRIPTPIPPPDHATAWKKVATRSRLRQAQDRPAVAQQKRSRQRSLGWMAVPLLLIGATVWGLLMTRSPSMIEVTTLPGQVRTITLSDDTTIRLHGESTLRYSVDYNKQERIVTLEGEAFFAVTQTGLPFEVYSETAQVRVLGTQFSVRSQETSTEVVVTEGRVRVMANQADQQPIELSVGEGVVVTPTQINSLDTNSVQDTEAWIAGSVTFDATPFPEAIDRLSRIWNTPIEITATGLETESVSGSIRLGDIQQTLETLCLTLGNSTCSVRREGNTYFIFTSP